MSSYALPGHRSKHNGNYWRFEGEWLAAGAGAADCVAGRRGTRPGDLKGYYEYVAGLKAGGAAVWEGGEEEGGRELLETLAMTSLRRAEGLDLGLVEREFGGGCAAAIRGAAEFFVGVGVCEIGGSVLRLTDPDGFLFSNQVLSEIFLAIEGEFD